MLYTRGKVSAKFVEILPSLYDVRVLKKTVKNIEGVLIAIGCFLGMSVFRFNPGILIAAAILVGITAQSLSSLKRKYSECAEKEEKK